jgi:hypothetical protein
LSVLRRHSERPEHPLNPTKINSKNLQNLRSSKYVHQQTAITTQFTTPKPKKTLSKRPISPANPQFSPNKKTSNKNPHQPRFHPNKIHAPRVYTSKDMSTSTISVDEFQALEQKVLRAVEIVKQEREARAKAEAEVVSLREQLEFQTLVATEAQTAITTLNKERDGVRQRVEKMLQQMDELL